MKFLSTEMMEGFKRLTGQTDQNKVLRYHRTWHENYDLHHVVTDEHALFWLSVGVVNNVCTTLSSSQQNKWRRWTTPWSGANWLFQGSC